VTIPAVSGHPPPMGALLLEGPGSTADFAAVYRREFDYVWSCLRALGVREAELEDGAQAVFLVVHRRLAAFDGRAQLRTWLFAIAARVAARGRRDHARAQRRRLALADAMPRATPAEELDEGIAAREVLALMERFAEGLDPAMHDVFSAWFFDGRTPQEIADALGLSRNTVFSRLRLIRARLQRVCERIAAHDDATLDADTRRRAQTRVQAIVLGLGGRAPWGAIGLAAAGALGVVAIAVGVAWSWPAARPSEAPAREPVEVATGTVGAAVLPSPSSTTALVDTTPEPTPAPTPAPARARPRAPAAAPAPSVDPAADLAASVALVAEIRSAIQAGRDDDAKASIQRHRDRFPEGPLTGEREGFAAIVACRSAHDPAPGRAYVAAHPGTAMARRVESICVTSSDDAPR
jgi:RNA polymerase sigma-70 factor (ECF subfamily)